MNSRKKKENANEKACPELTAAERTAVDKHLARHAAKPPRFKCEVSKEGSLTFKIDHPNRRIGSALIMESIGTADEQFFTGMIVQLTDASSQHQKIDEIAFNFMLSVIQGVQPRDQLEAMLAAQMAAVHAASMTFARRLANVDNIPQQDSAERAFNKLTRTFAAQMEALKRYRTGGEQKVTVQHVSVAEGGQAIVGNVTQAQRENTSGKAASPPPALPDSNVVPMTIIDENKERAHVAGRRKSTK
jgi:hypothetical protein